MQRITYILLFLLIPLFPKAQNPLGNYNPYVNSGAISPSPLLPLEVNGKGVVSFTIGNDGNDTCEVYSDQYITLTITLSYGVPDNADPLAAVGGSYAGLFSWSYNAGTYTATQVAPIPSKASGKITINYKVTQNSSSPGLNGFNVNISPAPYHTTSNKQADDAVHSYNYTEIRDFGDAPAGYGSAYHIMDFVNYLGSVVDGEPADLSSTDANSDDTNGQDDEDGVVFPAQMHQGEIIAIPVTVVGTGRLNAWIDWNGDGDFADAGEQVASNVARVDGTVDLSVTIPAGARISAPTFARFRFSPATLSSGTGLATGGEVEDYRITILASLFAPTVPTGLKINSSTETSVSLSWNASTDNVGVTGYRIYRGETFLGTSTVLSYTDNTVSAGNSYTYSVSATDGDGNESAQSSTVTADILDITAPSVPAGLAVTSATISAVSLSWEAASDNVGVTGYRIYRDGTLLLTTSDLSCTDNTVSPGNTYIYSISAIDAAVNASEQSQGVTANTNDTTPPSVPAGLIITSSTETEVSLSWEASTDNVGVTAYTIYRDGTLLDTVTVLIYTDNTVGAGNSYSYTIAALDEAGNESGQSSGVDVSINDTTPPSVPAGLSIISTTETGVSLTWDASTDNVEVTGYNIYREGTLLESSASNSYTDNTLSTGVVYTYAVSATDAAGNESALSAGLIVTVNDTIPPTVPEGLQALSASDAGLQLTWEASTDNVEVAAYNIYRGGVFLSTVTEVSGTDKTIFPGNTYTYSVSAVDLAGNESKPSEAVTVSISSTEFILVSELSVYPNPSDGEFVIDINETSGKFTLEIMSSPGNITVQSIIYPDGSKLKLNYDYLNTGIYFMRLYNKDRLYYGKIVIQK